MEELIPITLFLMVGLIGLARSRIGEAIADRIRSGPASSDLHAEVAQLRQDLEVVRQELMEAQERLDFAERLLASGSHPDRLRGGRVEG